ncbi:DoxX family protein [Paenibacillus sp. N1-5-1-14]|uniref:DoxX family protein n=1 Tax=Paenibacillus radicibacter TaxID=2972488 RepID=UPI002158ECAE|nr:DoxX family protein [Paenibacillus radicibacter]MCR8642920.1 DoxX family protein [Paenibacillus radicibacter]
MSKVMGAETIAKAEIQSRGKMIAYWSVTIYFAISMTISGIGQLIQLEGNVELVTKIGYPLYILTILGIWKVLGAIALIVPGVPRLKEWAYAGFFFLLTGAAVSHTLVDDYGDSGFKLILPLCYAALTMASWVLRPNHRKL